MPKYTVRVTFHGEVFTFDTDDYKDDFATTKDELPDKLDPNDPAIIKEYIYDMGPEEFISSTPDLEEVDVSPIV